MNAREPSRVRVAATLAIVPAWNEQDSLAATLADLASHPEVDVVVINDGSTDATSRIAHAAGVRVLDLPINLGIGGAVQAGLRLADRDGYAAAFQFDADGQHMAAQIPLILAPVLEGEQDVVIGSRFLGARSYDVPAMRRFGIRLLNAACSACSGYRITDATSGFRAYGPRAIAALARDYPQDYPEPESIVALGKRRMRVAEVPVAMRERVAGRSSITPIRSGYYMAKVLLAVLVRALGPADPAP